MGGAADGLRSLSVRPLLPQSRQLQRGDRRGRRRPLLRPADEGETLAECIAEYKRYKTDWKLDAAQYEAFLDCEIAAKSDGDSFMCSAQAMKHHQEAISEEAYRKYMSDGQTDAPTNESASTSPMPTLNP